MFVVRHNDFNDETLTSTLRSYNYNSCSWGAWGSSFDQTRRTRWEYAGGNETPRFHLKKKRGDLLPYNHYVRLSGRSGMFAYNRQDYYPAETRCGKQTLRTERRNQCMTAAGYTLPDENWEEFYRPPGEIRSEGERLLITAASRMIDGFDALTFAVELRSVMRMLVGILQRWLTKLRSGRIEDLWLEGRYGWRPLIYDYLSLVEAIKHLDRSIERLHERAGLNNSTSEMADVIRNWNFPNELKFSYLVGTQTNVRADVMADVAIPPFRIDPVNTAWELIKFSFVIDWFVDVGSWLAALELKSMVKGMSCGVGYKKTVSVQLLSITQTGSFTPVVVWTPTSDCTMDYSISRRYPASIPSLPSARIRLDAFKIFDLIALIRQAVARR